MSPTETRELAHRLIDRMAISQVAAVVRVLEIIVDPVAHSLANAPFEDEPISEDEERDVAASKEWLKHNKPIPHEEVLAEFGLTSGDFESEERAILEPQASNR
jgi:hypothetical protein